MTAADRDDVSTELLDHIPGMVYRADADLARQLRYVSLGATALTGLSPEQLTGAHGPPLGELVHPDDRGHVEGVVSAALRDGTPFELEYRLLRPDGAIRWVWEHGGVYRGPDDLPASLGGVLVDVTDRRTAETALRESEQRFALALESSRNALWDWRVPENDLYLSPQWKEQLGYTDDELDNSFDTWRSLLHPDDRDRMMGRVADHLSAPAGPWQEEFRLRHRDGSYLWIQARAATVVDGDGRVTRMLGTHIDLTQRIEREQERERSARLFREMLASVELAAVILDADGRIAFCNDHLCSILGRQREELEGADWFTTCLPETECAEIRAMFEEAVTRDRFPRQHVNDLITVDGRRRTIRWSNVVLRDLDGQLMGSASIGDDVTDRVAAERALLDSEARYRFIFESLPVSVWEEDISGLRSALDALRDEGVEDLRAHLQSSPELTGDLLRRVRVLDVNPATLQIYAAEDKRELLASLDTVLTPESVPVFLEMISVIDRGEARFRAETINRTVEGEPIDVDLSVAIPSRDAHDAPALVTAIDISERKRAERVLAMFRALVESSAQGAAWADPDRSIRYVNPALARLVGFDDPADLIGRDFKDFYPPDTWRVMTDDVLPAVMERGSWQGTSELLAVDGTRAPVLENMFSIRDEDGRVTAIGYVAADIREERHTQARLEEAARELARSNEELQQFAYVASHDLQEPLRMVSSYLQLIERRYGEVLDDDGREFIAFAVDGAKRMKALIDGLLAYSRVDTADRRLAPTDLDEVLRRVTHDLGPTLEETGGRVEWHSLPTVHGDAVQLAQLFRNLVGNALKFRAADPPRVEIAATDAHGAWELRVSDNGIGVEPEHRERVFEVFERLHPRNRYSGTGIGLAICRKIVHRHGGEIRIDDAPGPGTTVVFTLPADPGTNPSD